MNSPLVLDSETVLQLELSGLRLIEASAGTGKTYTIANLYLRHILEGKTPSQILVVTFTKAATEELRGRIRLRLHQTLQGILGKAVVEDEFLKLLINRFQSQATQQQQLQIDRLRSALANMDQAAISTIHSFCQQVLQDYALPSLQYFDNEILVDDRESWQSAIRDWWRRHTYRLTDLEWSLLNGAVDNYDDFSGQVEEVAKRRPTGYLPAHGEPLDELLRSIESLEPALVKLASSWQINRERLIEIIKTSEDLSRSKKLPYHPENFGRLVERVDKFFNSKDLLRFSEDLNYFSTDSLLQNSKASKRGSDANLRHDFFQSVAWLISQREKLLNTIRTTAIRQAVEDCRQQVLSERQSNQQLSYQDLIDYTWLALCGSHGKRLTSLIRQQFPVAMIDEFQDTDVTQYNIFSAVYFNQPKLSLTLIGDPKQAIYSFRGGDIFTYMKARQAPDLQHCILQTNWRSHPGLINAVNHFFCHRSDPFIFSDSIDFLPVNAAEVNRTSFLEINGKAQSAFTLWKIPFGPDNKPLSKESAAEYLNLAVANEVFYLLKQDSEQEVCIDGRNLSAGDIAILVRTGVQGQAIRAALENRGIAAVTIGKDNVFNSDEAAGLNLLLSAVVFPSHRNRLRQALASELLFYDHHKIQEICTDDSAWQDWIEQFHRLHQIWTTRGFIPMFQQLLRSFGLAEKLAGRNQPERRLTNLLHLGEILQQQSLQSSGIDNLLIWFQQQTKQSMSEEAELRLESDQELVKIITIHKSKGLEFPLVFLPFLWDCRVIDPANKQPVYFHDCSYEAIMDLGSDDIEQHRILADRERLAEDLRLLYVALTRARSKTYLAWGAVGGTSRNGNSGQSALSYLLHSRQTPEQLASEIANTIYDPRSLDEDLINFVQKAEDIELLDLPTEISNDKLHRTDFDVAEVQAAKASLVLKQGWKVSSFSGLSWDIHQPVATTERDTAAADAILNFPAGSHVGLLLHALLEDLDFCDDIAGQCHRLVPRYAPKFGLDPVDFTIDIGHWLNQVINTALIQPGLSLSVLSSRRRLNELAFDFALDYCDIERLNRFFSMIQQQPHAAITAQDFRGLITGIIDLVFEFDGRYYLADYKSNFLGNHLDNYNPAGLQLAMLERRYDLQLMIYSIALHRYLRQRIKNYDYRRHFGGAYYLFLRGMRQQSGSDFGVYFERPAQDRIEVLDTLFSYDDTVIAR